MARDRTNGIETMQLQAFVAAVKKSVARSFRRWGPVARASWCRSQRRQLDRSAGAVSWVRGDVVPWAVWGARHGYFEVQYMDGLPYLSALPAPAV